jgi:phosphomannomutase
VAAFSDYVPTPALALDGSAHGMPSLMVTSSRIPTERNGN